MRITCWWSLCAKRAAVRPACHQQKSFKPLQGQCCLGLIPWLHGDPDQEMDPWKLKTECVDLCFVLFCLFFRQSRMWRKRWPFLSRGRLHLCCLKSVGKAHSVMAGLETCGLSPMHCCFVSGLNIALPVVLLQLLRDNAWSCTVANTED